MFRHPTEAEQLEVIVLGSQAIENQEVRGQKAVVTSTTLPIDGSMTEAAKASPIQWGDRKDALFREAILPPGWKKLPTDHAMWSKLVDEKGRGRAMIFYKSAFYDTSAHIEFNRRFRIAYAHVERDANNNWLYEIYNIEDLGLGPNLVVIHAVRFDYPERSSVDGETWCELLEAGRKAAATWLLEHYPNCDDPNAYWDETPAI